jgi:uncharacterized membrane protein HdeD (DUF308 family)
MVEGISRIAFALMIRPMEDWHYVLISGIVGLLLAVVLGANIGSVSNWLLGLLLGMNLIASGAGTGYLAWNLRKAVA